MNDTLVKPTENLRASPVDPRNATRPGLRLIPANHWQGESGCIVGPFASRSSAEWFAEPPVDFGTYETHLRRVTFRTGRWYVEIHAR